MACRARRSDQPGTAAARQENGPPGRSTRFAHLRPGPPVVWKEQGRTGEQVGVLSGSHIRLSRVKAVAVGGIATPSFPNRRPVGEQPAICAVAPGNVGAAGVKPIASTKPAQGHANVTTMSFFAPTIAPGKVAENGSPATDVAETEDNGPFMARRLSGPGHKT